MQKRVRKKKPLFPITQAEEQTLETTDFFWENARDLLLLKAAEERGEELFPFQQRLLSGVREVFKARAGEAAAASDENSLIKFVDALAEIYRGADAGEYSRVEANVKIRQYCQITSKVAPIPIPRIKYLLMSEGKQKLRGSNEVDGQIEIAIANLGRALGWVGRSKYYSLKKHYLAALKSGENKARMEKIYGNESLTLKVLFESKVMRNKGAKAF